MVKVARRKMRIYELGVSYAGCASEEGKKIVWTDSLRAPHCLVKYSLNEPKATLALNKSGPS